MKKYRITKRGKLSIFVFSIFFLIVNISFIPVIRTNTWKYMSVVENRAYAMTTLNNSHYKLNNESKENKIILSKNDSTVKKSPEIPFRLQTTPQAASVEINAKVDSALKTTSQAISTQNIKELKYPVELAYKDDGKKIAFLTFDDGPTSTNTPKILEILKHYSIKATFFIIGYEAEKNKDVLVEIKNEGHAIGNHTYSHNYEKIYSSVEKFIAEIKKTDEVFKQILGDDFKTRICRFPGGSFGESKRPFIQELEREGYANIDWNTITGDAEGINIDKDKLLNRLERTAKEQKHLVILMHDSPSKNTTVEALPEIIEYLKEKGYEFATLE